MGQPALYNDGESTEQRERTKITGHGEGLNHKPIFSSKTFSVQRQNTERKTEWVDGRRN